MTRWSTDARTGLRLPVGARQWLTRCEALGSLPQTFPLQFSVGTFDTALQRVPDGHVAVVTHVHIATADLTDTSGAANALEADNRWSLFAGDRLWFDNVPAARAFFTGGAVDPAQRVSAVIWDPDLPIVVCPVLQEGQTGRVDVTGGSVDAVLGWVTGWVAPISVDLARELGVD